MLVIKKEISHLMESLFRCTRRRLGEQSLMGTIGSGWPVTSNHSDFVLNFPCWHYSPLNFEPISIRLFPPGPSAMTAPWWPTVSSVTFIFLLMDRLHTIGQDRQSLLLVSRLYLSGRTPAVAADGATFDLINILKHPASTYSSDSIPQVPFRGPAVHRRDTLLKSICILIAQSSASLM